MIGTDGLAQVSGQPVEGKHFGVTVAHTRGGQPLLSVSTGSMDMNRIRDSG